MVPRPSGTPHPKGLSAPAQAEETLLLARIFPIMRVHHLDQNQGSEVERQSDTLHQKCERRSVANK
jgi:hypothetical protein